MLLHASSQRKKLHPLSRACVDLGDGMLDELIGEVARACSPPPPPPPHAELLEGVSEAEQRLSAPRLSSLLEVEAELTDRSAARMRAALAASSHALSKPSKPGASEARPSCLLPGWCRCGRLTAGGSL